MGYHLERDAGQVPVIVKDGGTTSWRDVKKALRKWYLDEAAALRDVSEKSYFQPSVEEQVEASGITKVLDALSLR